MAKKSDKTPYAKLKKEITVFLIFMGVLIGIGGYFSFTGLRGNPHPLWGFERHIALGVPMLVLALALIASGVCFAKTSRKIFAIAGALATTLFVLGYFALMISVTGAVPINLISVVLVAVVVVVWSRVVIFPKTEPVEGLADQPTADPGSD